MPWPPGCARALQSGMCHEAFTNTRTPLPSGWLNRDGLLGYVCRQDYFKSLHYSSDETQAGKVLVFGLPTCAQHPHTEEWTQKNADINAPVYKDHEQRKASVRGVVNRQFFFYYEHLLSGTVSHSHNHQLEPGFLINAARTRQATKSTHLTMRLCNKRSVHTRTSQININSLLHCAGC